MCISLWCFKERRCSHCKAIATSWAQSLAAKVARHLLSILSTDMSLIKFQTGLLELSQSWWGVWRWRDVLCKSPLSHHQLDLDTALTEMHFLKTGCKCHICCTPHLQVYTLTDQYRSYISHGCSELGARAPHWKDWPLDRHHSRCYLFTRQMFNNRWYNAKFAAECVLTT